MTEAKSGEDAVQVVLDQGDAQAEALNVKEMLKNADLDSKGYSKEQTNDPVDVQQFFNC